jgi:hypothetical protein
MITYMKTLAVLALIFIAGLIVYRAWRIYTASKNPPR